MSTFGIDLGTTYSCIATLDRNGNPEIIRNQADASDTLASAVFFESEDNVIIGSNAKDMVESDGDRVVQFAKRYIGKDDAPNWTIDGQSYTPIDISTLILKRIKQMAEEQGHTVENVVITVPAYFGLEERAATRKAGELAGMNVLNLVNEPTAAALSYCARQFQEEKTILVYDLGGGTFDVTIVRMSVKTNDNGEDTTHVRVVATGGNDRLGGADWDNALFDHILNICCEENGLTPDEIEIETRQLIRSRVETAKKKLSSAENAKVKISVNGSMTTVNISREEFESLTTDKVAQTMSYVESVLAKANTDIDLVLLVGGSTYMPMIRNAVEARFPGKVQIHEPDRAVAMGAAIYANMLVEEGGDPTPVPVPDPDKNTTGYAAPEGGSKSGGGNTSIATDVFTDQTPRSFGPGVLNRDHEYIVDNLIKLGDDMPALAVKTYYTPMDNMERIVLRAFENMSPADSVVPCVDNQGNEQPCDPSDMVKLLGQLEMVLPANTKKNSPIEVTFQVDASGVYVKAMNVATGEIVDTTLVMKSTEDVDPSKLEGMLIAGE